MANSCLWAKVWFEFSGVVLSCLLPVKIGFHASKFHKLPIFPVFSQEKRPLHMVPQKNNYHLMSIDMWLGAERYLWSIWCITDSAPWNPQRRHCNWDELEFELHQSRDWFYMMSLVIKVKLIFCGVVNQKNWSGNWCLWSKVWFEYSGVIVSRVFPVKIWLHPSKFHKLPIFPVFFQEKDPCTWWIKNTDIGNWYFWVGVWFPYSGVLVSCLLPVKTWLHASKVHKLPVFSVFSQEQRPFHMVNQKHRYGQLLPVSQGLICI